MSRVYGTVSMGLRAPIIRQGDNMVDIVTGAIVEAMNVEGLVPRDRDVVCMTEAIVARAQGNYASVDQIAADVHNKFGGDTVGVIFPILSRNRFAICLRGIAKGCKKVVLMLSYPSDEVGNHLVDLDLLDEKGINPYTDVLTEAQWRELFGAPKNTFTGVDYVEYYANLIRECGAEAEVIFANDCRAILKYTKNVLNCDIHTRVRTKRLLKAAGAEKVFGLDEIMTESVDGSGWNARYGLLGSNKATEDTVKLFPREECQQLVEDIQAKLLEITGKHIEVMVYGDGAFKDPIGKIWELADPVVSPAYTPGLEGTPNELKLKYLADNDFANLSGKALQEAIKSKIQQKDGSSLVCVHVNHGLMRKGESEQVIEVFGKELDANLIYVDATNRFLDLLANVAEPEKKRKIIGGEFIKVFDEEAAKLEGIEFLAQGTIYPDILESDGVKAHHNVGGLPEDMQMELVEPVKLLFKDEVRVVGEALGLPRNMVYRQPFPGPGLGVRCLGAITRDRLHALREADAILREEFDKNGLAGKVWQYFIAVPDFKSVGVRDGKRYEGWAAIIRAVNTTDAMSATIEEIPYPLIHHITNRITHEVEGINRVMVDVTPKPVGTIEFE